MTKALPGHTTQKHTPATHPSGKIPFRALNQVEQRHSSKNGHGAHLPTKHS